MPLPWTTKLKRKQSQQICFFFLSYGLCMFSLCIVVLNRIKMHNGKKQRIQGVLNNPLQVLNNSDSSNKLKVTTDVSRKPKIILSILLLFFQQRVCNALLQHFNSNLKVLSIPRFIKREDIAFHILTPNDDPPYIRRHHIYFYQSPKSILRDSTQPFGLRVVLQQTTIVHHQCNTNQQITHKEAKKKAACLVSGSIILDYRY